MGLFLQLFTEFFKIGLFAIGGGMATIPFLAKLASPPDGSRKRTC